MNDPGEDSAGGLPARPVAPADRDHVVDVLTRHFAEDRISEAEFEARLDRVYRAATVPELDTVLAGLQVMPDTGTRSVPAPVRPDAGRAVVRAPRRITALLSGREQSLAGVNPDGLQIRSRLAHIGIDLTQATFEPGVTEIEVRALMGNIELVLPASVRVETEVRVILGDFSMSGGSGPSAAENAPVVRITGRVVLGAAQCIVRAAGGTAPSIGPGTQD